MATTSLKQVGKTRRRRTRDEGYSNSIHIRDYSNNFNHTSYEIKRDIINCPTMVVIIPQIKPIMRLSQRSKRSS